jgi:hypothetical protein
MPAVSIEVGVEEHPGLLSSLTGESTSGAILVMKNTPKYRFKDFLN